MDEVGTADILGVENATLKGNDREFLLRALASRANNEHLRIADKISDIDVSHPEKLGTFTVQKYQHEPNNQVVDLSSCFDLSNKEDYKEAVDSLRKKARLAVFQAWLSAAVDEPKRL